MLIDEVTIQTHAGAPVPIPGAVWLKLDRIAIAPHAKDNNVTRLQNRPGYRLRVGDWRVIYEIREDELVILILKIGPRGGVYR